MALKRKRSYDSSPLSTSSYTSSPPSSQSPTPLPDAMETSAPTPFNFSLSWGARKTGWDEPSSAICRTRKRFRDNRPDERVIHENTLSKLFSAQRNHPNASPILSSPPTTTTTPSHLQPTTTHVQKSTLHSFWKIPAPPVQAPSIQLQQPVSWDAPRCEDCDAALVNNGITGGMDVDVDVDVDMEGAGVDGFACADCGKRVCGTCAVVANARHCLQCATTGRRAGRWW